MSYDTFKGCNVIDKFIVVHRYRALDPETGDWVVQLSRASEDYIRQSGGRIIENTAEQLHFSKLDSQGRAVPTRVSAR
jgi:hypothetical protein